MFVFGSVSHECVDVAPRITTGALATGAACTFHFHTATHRDAITCARLRRALIAFNMRTLVRLIASTVRREMCAMHLKASPVARQRRCRFGSQHAAHDWMKTR